MSILVSTIADQCRAIGLDADGTDYYDDELHMIPAINAAMRWLMSTVSLGLHQKRFSEEVFKKIIRLKVFQTNTLGRILIDEQFYSILNVQPLPTCLPNSDPDLTGDAYDSEDMSEDKHYVSGSYQCHRITSEQVNHYKGNPFKAGNTTQTVLSELTVFSYYSPIQYGIWEENVPGAYLEIFPSTLVSRKLCAITYIETQDEITALDDELNFDDNFINILAAKTTSFLTLKQGDYTTVHNVSEQDVIQLMQALN